MSSPSQTPVRPRSWIALLAAYLIALQGLLGAAQTARALDLAAFDRQIHLTLCAPDAEGTSPDGDTSGAGLPGCCATACLLAVAAYVPPALPLALSRDPGLPATILSPRLEGASGFGWERFAARPRGPPVSA